MSENGFALSADIPVCHALKYAAVSSWGSYSISYFLTLLALSILKQTSYGSLYLYQVNYVKY